MATKDFLLPDLGEGLTEGEIVSWLVAVGDVVELDQNVAEIETAKAVVEVPSPFAGTVSALHGEPGQEIMVGAPLITIEVGGDGEPPAEAAPEVGSEVVSAVGSEVEEGSGSVLVGYGTSGGGGSRRRRVSGANGSTAPVQREGRPLAKPPVRKMAKDHGVDLALVLGSGPDGTITRADVQSFLDAQGAPAASAGAGPAPAAPSAPSTPAPAPEPVAIPAAPAGALAQQRVPLSQIRKAISAQMVRSRREIPEAVTWVDADATALWALREELNAAQSDVKVSPTAIILRMVVAGLRRFPTLNASLDTTTSELVLHRHVNLGFAAQTDRGLVVPVIEGAQDLSILGMAERLNELAATARAGRLTPAQMSGGTFTVSNYGAFGVDGGDMVINHPEAAILGTGRIVDRPWVVDGELAVRKVITYSIAFDHRIIDGGEAGGFLRFVADLTENPTLLVGAL
jgi:2-oxoisovalerate dehydrogenase E2 component (dihydrolipoyl transacylase)